MKQKRTTNSKILAEANKKGISPYMLLKEKLEYRVVGPDTRKHCQTCRHITNTPYFGDKKQCFIIGLGDNLDACIDIYGVCRKHKYKYF